MNTNNKDTLVCLRLMKQRKLLKKTQAYVADICGVSTKTVGRWESDTAIPSDQLEKLYNAGFDVNYIITGEKIGSHLQKEESDAVHPIKNHISDTYTKWDQETESGQVDPTFDNQVGSHATGAGKTMSAFAAIPLLNILSAEGFSYKIDDSKVINSIVFKKEWIHNELRTSPSHLRFVHVEGDSMEPNLSAGDIILVDQSSKAKRDGIHVIIMDGTLLIKRLQRLPDGIIRISSDNPVYEPYEFSAGWDINNSLTIIGRVVWSGCRL